MNQKSIKQPKISLTESQRYRGVLRALRASVRDFIQRRQRKRLKDLGDIARLAEAHPDLWEQLPSELRQQLDKPS